MIPVLKIMIDNQMRLKKKIDVKLQIEMTKEESEILFF